MNARETSQANRLVNMQKRFAQFYNNRIAVTVTHNSVVISPDFLEVMADQDDWDIAPVEDSALNVTKTGTRLKVSMSNVRFVVRASIRYKDVRFEAFLTERYCIDHGIDWRP